MAIVPLEEMLELPDCPNLYWALTNLPEPFISIKTGLEGERLTIWGFTRELDSTAPMGSDEIKRFIERLEKLFGANSPITANGGVRGYLAAHTKDEKKLAAASKRLVESQLPDALLKTFPADQVILLDEVRELRARFDEIAKIMVFPAWQFEALGEKASAVKQEPAILADAFLPSQSAVHQAQARLAQRFALLRHVEALRMYAADHKGALPARLSEISVPLPDDPFTGKPFRYELLGAVAHLRGTPPKSAQHNPFLRMHYEITVRN
jgi:hypothetical protein